ncbi:MAG: DUF6305 family protein [Bacillota bacterium]|uniref:DUF6305 domain-containing protein n=2 Tax=Carboxydocella TaxID=178898 RepID=A0A1T4QVS1_9FIRM|nr:MULTISPECIES: DUF6305 family protein [Carboxydocella]AVX21673.1 hypothetical protein CFE_2530 [Carboxydocella thermautotrophica]AVX32084.1 hypothetical protein CTH_2545 [Carboxydocella thermautotrophica]SKA07795.1 hypothetical protein SAMN02745885_01824 [Carboxydocella sporoproducens DSM 16521]GAW27680.1 hypothetical protein ULO1_02500 [Carboxydocella sp. ULO1]GAW31875.1 hypothetical protein JDF658_16400 [Carboxydocella sp. JDF658]
MSAKVTYWKKWMVVFFLLCFYVLAGLFFWSEKGISAPEATEIPHLPVPIAREPVLVTGLGQGPGGVIINRLTSVLNIDHTFRYKAEYRDLTGYKTLIVVIDYNVHSMKAAYTDWQEERQRVLNLVAVARGQGMRIIGVLCQPGPDLTAIWPYLDYLLVIEITPGQDWQLETYQGLLSRVSSFEQAKIPLNAVFR